MSVIMTCSAGSSEWCDTITERHVHDMRTGGLAFVSDIQSRKKKNVLFKSLFHEILHVTVKYSLSTKRTMLRCTCI